jgi:DNA-binding LacI/PurR family transcriptional regulator
MTERAARLLPVERSRPTLVDVARVAGVSRSTASRAINGQRAVAEDVRRRVLRAVATLGYHPDASARALASGRLDVLDLVVVEQDVSAFSANPFYGRVTAGLLEALSGTDVQMRIHVTPTSTVAQVLDDMAKSGSLGTLLVNVPGQLAERFHRRYRPVVSLGRFGAGVPYSEAENARGSALAVGHLLSAGRRVIAAIDGPAWNPCAVERHDGYLETMASAGLTPMWTAGDFRRQGGYAATLRLLKSRPDVDAIFAACDLTAAGAIQALTATGRRVPEDVAVIGFDDSVVATTTNPALTAVRQPVEEMTARAARELMYGHVDRSWHESFPVTLSVRASTGQSSQPRPEPSKL